MSLLHCLQSKAIEDVRANGNAGLEIQRAVRPAAGAGSGDTANDAVAARRAPTANVAQKNRTATGRIVR
jgi:hypothetical protein